MIYLDWRSRVLDLILMGLPQFEIFQDFNYLKLISSKRCEEVQYPVLVVGFRKSSIKVNRADVWSLVQVSGRKGKIRLSRTNAYCLSSAFIIWSQTNWETQWGLVSRFSVSPYLPSNLLTWRKCTLCLLFRCWWTSECEIWCAVCWWEVCQPLWSPGGNA